MTIAVRDLSPPASGSRAGGSYRERCGIGAATWRPIAKLVNMYASHYITLHYIASHYIILYYIVLYSIT